MKAIILNLSAWVMLPIMDGFAKYLSFTLPILQITWARYFFTVVFTLPIMFFFFNKYLVWTEKPKLQLIRVIILFCANISKCRKKITPDDFSCFNVTELFL